MSVLFKTRVFVPGKEKPELFKYAIVGVLFSILIYELFPDDWYFLPALVVSSALTYIQQYYFDSGRQKLHGYLGRYFIIEDDRLNINGVNYLFTDLEDLTFDVRDFDGEEFIGAYAISIERGVNNSVSFRFKDENYKFQFHIESKESLSQLRTALDSIIITGIKVKALFKGHYSNTF